jgi:hypothetical protein
MQTLMYTIGEVTGTHTLTHSLLSLATVTLDHRTINEREMHFWLEYFFFVFFFLFISCFFGGRNYCFQFFLESNIHTLCLSSPMCMCPYCYGLDFCLLGVALEKSAFLSSDNLFFPFQSEFIHPYLSIYIYPQ